MAEKAPPVKPPTPHAPDGGNEPDTNTVADAHEPATNTPTARPARSKDTNRLGIIDDHVADDITTSREELPWERDDAPPGSTSESLLDYERGVPVRVTDVTHYHRLGNGQTIGGYGIGTHHTVAGENGEPDRIYPVIGISSGI
jgi:hypothetical protein